MAKSLLIDRIQKFTETHMPQGSYYLHAKPKGKSKFESRVGCFNQSMK